MGILTEWITEWLKGLLIEGIMGNLTGLFDTVNTSHREKYFLKEMRAVVNALWLFARLAPVK